MPRPRNRSIASAPTSSPSSAPWNSRGRDQFAGPPGERPPSRGRLDDCRHVVSSFGWVVALRDGRRLYLEYTLSDLEGEVEGEPDEELMIAPLAASQAYPVLDNDAGAFWYRPDHINDHSLSEARGCIDLLPRRRRQHALPQLGEPR
jgi:hypothetical protein